MKSERQKAILEIIANEKIENQAQLNSALSKKGIISTQATLSRDIKDLKLIKISENGLYYYSRSDEKIEKNSHSDRLRKILKDSIISMDTAQNLLVIHTVPGVASGVCSVLDGIKQENLVGTLAGDDTAFVAMKTNQSAEELKYQIISLIES